MSFGFERPFFLVAAFVIVPLAVYLAGKMKNPFRFLIPLGAPGGIPFRAPYNIENLLKALRAIEWIGILLLLLGAAGPELSGKKTVWLNRGADILFVIDTSPSMAALDMNGASRFNAARSLITEFANARPADGIGLIAVGDEAALLIPPSTDREALLTRLEQLRIAELGNGTALGMGLSLAAFHLEKSTAQRRAVVLVTDGENNAGAVHPETAAAILHNMGVTLWLIGIGSSGEVPIDYVDPYSNMRRSGTFDSRFDIDSMMRICTAGGGHWLPAASAPALTAAFARIDSQELVVRRSGVAAYTRSARLPFLVIALCLLAGIRFIKRFFLRAFA